MLMVPELVVLVVVELEVPVTDDMRRSHAGGVYFYRNKDPGCPPLRITPEL